MQWRHYATMGVGLSRICCLVDIEISMGPRLFSREERAASAAEHRNECEWDIIGR
jgi:hypothetical protein